MEGIIQTEGATITRIAPDIVKVELEKNAIVTLSVAQLQFSACCELTEGRPHKVLVDLTKAGSIEPDARSFLSSDQVQSVQQAAAMLSSSPLTMMIGSLFVKLGRPSGVVRIFSKEEKALEWLRKQKTHPLSKADNTLTDKELSTAV